MRTSWGYGWGVDRRQNPKARGEAGNPINILGSDLLAWWTADRADLITLSGAAVTSWKDVTHGYDAVQGISAARPVYSATVFGGSPGLTFDGVDDELTFAPASAFPLNADPGELFALVKQDALVADTGSRYAFTYGNGINSDRRLERCVVTGVNRGRSRTGTGATSVTATGSVVDLSSRHWMRGEFTATEVKIAIDEASAVAAAAVSATSANRSRIGATSSGTATSFWHGSIRDILVTLPLSAEKLAALKAWALPRRNV